MEEIKLETRTIKIRRGDKELIYSMRELTGDEYYSIRDSCIDKKSENFELDSNKLNLTYLAKSITQPSMTLESVAKLPSSITQRLITEFNILNSVEQTFFLESSPKNTQKKE